MTSWLTLSSDETRCYLIGVQFALIHWVGVLDDFDLVLTEPLAVETLRETRTEASSTVLLHSSGATTLVFYLQPVRDFSQLGDGGFFVHKLLLIQVAKLGAVKSNSEVRTKHPLSVLPAK